jgi:carbonic anhydrase
VLQYGVDLLKVRHVIVCGHYGCGGIKAAVETTSHGLVDNWLRHVRDIYHHRRAELQQIQDGEARLDRLCELNVVEQVINVGNTTIVQDAWERGQAVTVHGWIYAIADGLLKDLTVTVSSRSELDALYTQTEK